MPADHLDIFTRRQQLQRISWWAAVVLYTAALPYVILVFRGINQLFSPQIATNVPLILIILLALFYAIVCVKHDSAIRCILILAVSALIVFFIMKFETNTNKYIHIPEYVLITWLLFQALALDYKGRGIFLLILICATMLGIVDEILQGIHLQRTYGWKDMIIDGAASFIGILTLMSIKRRSNGDWIWLGHLKQFMGYLAIILFGALTAVAMCVYLFDVQEQGRFWDVYPRWLLTLNGIFTATAVASVVFFWRNRQRSVRFTNGTNTNASSNETTALLWVMCPLVILISMHALVIWVAAAGLEFS